jgi:hypothetical protein
MDIANNKSDPRKPYACSSYNSITVSITAYHTSDLNMICIIVNRNDKSSVRYTTAPEAEVGCPQKL